jgi:chaperonin GroEL
MGAAFAYAFLLLTTEVMIAEAPKEEERSHGGAPGGMGGMGGMDM